MNLLKKKAVTPCEEEATISQLKVGSKHAKTGIYGALILYSLIILLPLLWLIFTSLKTKEELFQSAWSVPQTWQFRNYYLAWTKSNIPVYMRNSITAASVSLFVTFISSVTMAYVLSRFQFKGRKIIYYVIIAGMMIPIHSAVIPLYVLAMKLDMQNNLVALGIIYAAFRIPVSVFFLESYMRCIPKELEEAALIDGCGYWKTFSKVILPMSVDGVITILILALLACWNELLVSMLMIGDPNLKTLPIGIMGFITEYNTEITQMCAGIIIACVPNLLFYIILQDKIVKGMTIGAVKG